MEFVLVAAVLAFALTLPLAGRSVAEWLSSAVQGAGHGFAAWLAVV